MISLIELEKHQMETNYNMLIKIRQFKALQKKLSSAAENFHATQYMRSKVVFFNHNLEPLNSMHPPRIWDYKLCLATGI